MAIKMSDKIFSYDNISVYLNTVKDKVVPVLTSPLYRRSTQAHAPTALSSETVVYPLNT